jgi:hypothetical protein
MDLKSEENQLTSAHRTFYMFLLISKQFEINFKIILLILFISSFWQSNKIKK